MRNSIFSLLLVFLIGCNSKDENLSRLDHVPVKNPNELIRFNEIGDNLLSHIGYTSIVLEDGHILVPDRQHVKLFKADSKGKLIETIGRRGNGPGEYQDITFLSQSAYGSILIYDQMNQKVIVLDSLGQYNTEFSIPSNSPSGSLIELHEVIEQQYLMIFRSSEYLLNENSEQVSYLVTYDIRQDKFSPTIKIDSRPYARITGGGGGARVPYAAADLFAYNYKTSDIYLFKSDGQRIAQLDASLDTVQVVSLDIESELITRTELDSLRAEYPEYWASMQSMLPEYKAVADQLMIDHKNNFWLKLNHSSKYQQWLVASGQGELLQNVRLPKGSMLTHISEKHLGVRLDDITFALFDYPEIQ